MSNTVKKQLKNLNSNAQAHNVKSSQTSSYTAALQRDVFLSRSQGLILETKEGLTLTDYTIAVGKILKPENVIYASRISNGRI